MTIWAQRPFTGIPSAKRRMSDAGYCDSSCCEQLQGAKTVVRVLCSGSSGIALEGARIEKCNKLVPLDFHYLWHLRNGEQAAGTSQFLP